MANAMSEVREQSEASTFAGFSFRPAIPETRDKRSQRIYSMGGLLYCTVSYNDTTTLSCQ
jgi:hypothetical protein